MRDVIAASHIHLAAIALQIVIAITVIVFARRAIFHIKVFKIDACPITIIQAFATCRRAHTITANRPLPALIMASAAVRIIILRSLTSIDEIAVAVEKIIIASDTLNRTCCRMQPFHELTVQIAVITKAFFARVTGYAMKLGKIQTSPVAIRLIHCASDLATAIFTSPPRITRMAAFATIFVVFLDLTAIQYSAVAVEMRLQARHISRCARHRMKVFVQHAPQRFVAIGIAIALLALRAAVEVERFQVETSGTACLQAFSTSARPIHTDLRFGTRQPASAAIQRIILSIHTFSIAFNLVRRTGNDTRPFLAFFPFLADRAACATILVVRHQVRTLPGTINLTRAFDFRKRATRHHDHEHGRTKRGTRQIFIHTIITPDKSTAAQKSDHSSISERITRTYRRRR